MVARPNLVGSRGMQPQVNLFFVFLHLLRSILVHSELINTKIFWSLL